MSQKHQIIIFTLLPVLWLAWLINYYTVDTPLYDEMNDTINIMAQCANGTFNWHDLMTPSNGHYILFPRLLAIATGSLTGWNMTVGCWEQLALALVVLFNVYKIAKMCDVNLICLPFASVLIFSPSGFENWQFGHQTMFWLAMACFTSTAWFSNCRYGMLSTALLSTVASFSIGGGCLCWLVALPALWFKHSKHKCLQKFISIIRFLAKKNVHN
jgi:hypothetical protein